MFLSFYKFKFSLRRLITVFIFLCYAPLSLAESMYIIDRLLVGLHEGKTRDSAITIVLPSDTRMEVLEKDDDFARVKAPTGETGWMDLSYLTDEKPARLVVKALEEWKKTRKEELAAAWEEVETLRNIVKKSQKQTAAPVVEVLDAPHSKAGEVSNNENLLQLQEENKALKVNLKSAREQLTKLATARTQLGPVPTSPTASSIIGEIQIWQWALLPVFFIMGIISGIWWLDRRIRKRHGGFRV